MASSPDLAATFNDALKETRQGLAETGDKIDDATKQALADEDQLLERLETAKTDRAQQSKVFTKHVENSVASLQEKVKEAKDTMEQMMQEVASTKTFTDEGIKQFTAQVGNLSNIETEHDDEVLTKIDADLAKYKVAHRENKQFEISNKHQTNAYRGEVERELKTLLYSLDEDAAREAGNQLTEELDMNTAMQSLRKHIEGDQAASQVANSAYLTKMLGRTEGMVNTAMQDEQRLEGKVASEEAGAQGKLEQADLANKKGLKQISSNEEALTRAEEDLKTQLKVVGNSMKSQLVLPMKTASKENVATDNKIRSLNSVLQNMQGKYPAPQGEASLLEVAENNTQPAAEPSSLAEVSSGANATGTQTEQQEVTALQKLNAELYRELVEDVRENSQLEKGLEKLKARQS